jgi:5-methyltetrahydropteroyltriglutamate--homocysteine methyltransferase
MTTSANLGFPRIGRRRELKKALEAYWAGAAEANALGVVAATLRAEAWTLERDIGIEHVPSNDFSLYDHVLDHAAMFGVVPARYRALGADPLRTYFAMARGHEGAASGVPALEMTKWFDTNYHYLVPELGSDDAFRLDASKPLAEIGEAARVGVRTRPVFLGPVSFLLLAKARSGAPLDRLGPLVDVYEELFTTLGRQGVEWIQVDEPCLVLDLPDAARVGLRGTYERLARLGDTPRVMLTTYFGGLDENTKLAASLPVAGLHVDLVRAPAQLDAVLASLPADRFLSVGVVDGRNVWRADLDAAYALVRRAADARGADRLVVAPSCSLLHCPVDRAAETKLDPELSSRLAFSTDKLREVAALARAVDTGDLATDEFEKSRRARETRRRSPRVHDSAVLNRMRTVTADTSRRASAYPVRRQLQRNLGLPLLPTTTIGSFPQTEDVRSARAEYKSGKRDAESYRDFLRKKTEHAVRWQEQIGIDVLVHGEFERNDMVEYFGERLSGFVFTENGWVQSYGSRCVKPPIIFGDVSRPRPMTIEWSAYAQSLTKLPMKGMLTGPVTILQWSFVRDDQPRSETCRQIALAIRDEVSDLERAGLKIIQIDEPAIREGLPLRHAAWAAYLAWAVECFRLSASSVADGTQIHTHMCYSEFNDIIEAVAAMDADVVSIETSRSKMELLDAFAKFRYPNEVGPGVYDIHSPRVPSEDEMVELLRAAARVVDVERLWVNPDCGLKTRRWSEVEPALVAMVHAARRVRAEHGDPYRLPREC